MLSLLADGILTTVIGIVAGLVVALFVFGLVFLAAVLPALKKGERAAADSSRSVTDGKEEEEAVRVLEEEIAEDAEESAETAEETPAEDAENAQASVAEEGAIADAAEELADDEEETESADPRECGRAEEENSTPSDQLSAAPEINENERFDRSFKARLIQSDEEIKRWYSEIKNAALSFEHAKNSLAWKQEKFRCGRNLIAKLILRGKTLCLYLPVTAEEIGDPSYKVEDVSKRAVNADAPTLLRIKNPRRVKQAKALIALVGERLGLNPTEAQNVDYTAELEPQSTDQLIGAGLIKIAVATPFDAIQKK